jgi:hypothetical protein
MLASPVALQGLKTVSRRRPQIFQVHRACQQFQLPPGNSLDRAEMPYRLIIRETRRIAAAEATDH